MKMKVGYWLCLLLAVAIPAGGQGSPARGRTADDWKSLDLAMGRTGQDQPDGAYKYSMPRKDLKVTAGGVELKPGLALGSWAAFKKMGTATVVMGDLVLTEDEVAPVMSALLSGGIAITALHNHLLHETPRILYMHISGKGDGTALGATLHEALGKTGTPPASPPSAVAQPELGIDVRQIDQILGHAGKNNGGIYQVSAPRAEIVREGGMQIPNSMGVATALNFQPTGAGRAAITGDFVLVAAEVNPVIQALKESGIIVTALHSHMLNEQPRLFFMHFWAHDDAIKLARGLRAALDKTNSASQK